MPKISQRGLKMPQSPIRKLVPFAEDAKRRGTKVYYLNIGQPDIPTAPLMLEAVKKYDTKVIEYSHSAGNESYRRKLAEYYKKQNINVDYTDIMITTGGSEAINFAFMSTMDVDDELIIPEPFYANYNSFASANGVQVIPVTSSIQNGFSLPSIEEFEKVITARTRGIMLSNPNNPTGCIYTKDDLHELKSIIKKYDLYLFADEVYREFCYTSEKFYSVMELEGIEENTILIDSVSKRYSACGVRIGALVTRNKEVINIAMRYAMARLSPPSFGQVAAEAAIDTPPEYFQTSYEEYLKRRNYLVERLNKMKGVFCPLPKGAFYTIAHLPVDDAEKFAIWLLNDFEYKGQTVLLAPASGFYATPELGKTEVRIAYVLNIDDLKNALDCIEAGLKAYPGNTID
jgi:aspartate aminotransferase